MVARQTVLALTRQTVMLCNIFMLYDIMVCIDIRLSKS